MTTQINAQLVGCLVMSLVIFIRRILKKIAIDEIQADDDLLNKEKCKREEYKQVEESH